MKKIKDLIISFFAVMIVTLGVYLFNFYLKNEISFTSVFCGIMGFLILIPAVFKWEKTLSGKNAHKE